MVCTTPVGRGDESSSPLSSPPTSICSPTPTPERELSVSPTSNPLSEIEAINLSPSESFTFKMKTRSRTGPRTPLPDSKVGETKKAGVVKTIKKTIGNLRRPKWDPKVVLTHHKSPLASADIRAILGHPLAWEYLAPEERNEVLALFPDDEHILDAGTENARVNVESLMNDDNFRYDCARFSENIALGRHDPEWLESAWAAHERRKAGDFDDFLIRRFEEEWQTTIPEDLKSFRPSPSAERTKAQKKTAQPKRGALTEKANGGTSSMMDRGSVETRRSSRSTDELHGKPEDYAVEQVSKKPKPKARSRKAGGGA